MFKSLVELVSNLFKRKRLPELQEWFIVEFDDEFIYRNVAPPNGEAYQDKFRWEDIERICFKCDAPYNSDELYFLSVNVECHLI